MAKTPKYKKSTLKKGGNPRKLNTHRYNNRRTLKKGGYPPKKLTHQLKPKSAKYDFFTYTSHYVGFNKKDSQENDFYYISPFQLNTVVLQYLIDNEKVKLVIEPSRKD